MSQGLIQGFMREAPLPDIIQLVSQGGKSGCFHVSEEAKRAKIYLKDGRIVHAITNDAEGLDAVYEIALWLDGHYNFEESDGQVPTTITKSNAAVLMEMHRRMDEWRVINQKISSLELYPHSTLLPGETPTGVSPREAKLLGLLTGFYTISELAEVLQKPVLNVAKDIYGLIMAGHVMLKGIRSGKRPDLPADMAPKAPAPAPEPAPAPMAEVIPATVPAPPPAPEPEPEPVLEATITPEPVAEPEPEPESVPVPEPERPSAPIPVVPRPGMPGVDPLRLAKLQAFAQRIVTASKTVLPIEQHEMVNRLHQKTNQQLLAGEGPDAVKNLALSISRAAVEAGLDAELVKNLNAQIKALFNK